MRALNATQRGTVADTGLASSIKKDVSDVKAMAGALFHGAFALANIHQSIITIGGRSYEIYDSGTGAATGGADVDINVNGAANWDAMIDLVVAGIMGDGGKPATFQVYNAENDVMGVVADAINDDTVTVVETADPNNLWCLTGSGTVLGGQAQAVKAQTVLQKTIVEGGAYLEATAMAAGNAVPIGAVDLGGVPRLVGISAMDANGVHLTTVGLSVEMYVIAGTEYMVTLLDGAAVLGNTDVVRVILEA